MLGRREKNKGSILIFYDFYNKLPQIYWLKMTEIYYLIKSSILQQSNMCPSELKSKCQQTYVPF